MKHPSPEYAGDRKIRDLLHRYACPVPFHAVRTRFLGNIATPRIGISPFEVFKDMWGGEWPRFDDMDAFNALLLGLTGLWNHLTGHESATKPFRLVRLPAGADPVGLGRLCQTRTEEIEGFIEGLYDGEEVIILRESASEALGHLEEINGLMHGVLDLLRREPPAPASRTELWTTLKNVQEVSRIAEKELHTVVLSCTRARQQALSAIPAGKPTIH